MSASRRRILLPLLFLGPVSTVVLTGYDYGGRVVVRSEADILGFDENEDMTEDERTQLLGLFNDPLDLNTASREDLYLLPDLTWELVDKIIAQRKAEPFGSPREVRSIVGRTIWQEIKPFVRAETTKKTGKPPTYKGSVSAKAFEMLKDDTTPMAVIRTRQQYGAAYQWGAVVAEEYGPYGFTYTDDGFEVEGQRANPSLERAYFQTKQGSWSAIAGNYMAGFGLGMAFDITNRTHPDGFYYDLEISEDTENYDSYSIPKRLLGVAAQAARIPVGDKWVKLTGFASYDPQDVYCADIKNMDFESFGCTANNDDEVDYVTFPHLYTEAILGFNAAYYWEDHSHVGFTGWGGHVFKQEDFVFSGISIPNRDFYGAGGIDVELNLNGIDLLAETAITDSGGVGARIETVSEVGNATELTAGFRYYATDFDNPHSRGQAEPDEYSLTADDEDFTDELEGGDRDRDEIGPQVAVVTQPTDWFRLRTKGDLWQTMSTELNNLYLDGRAYVDPLEWLGFDIEAYMKDKDISQGGREMSYDADSDGYAGGQSMSFGGGFRVDPNESFTFQASYKQRYVDGSDDEKFDHTWYTWAKVIWDATEYLTLSGRVKYYDETPGEDSGDHYKDLYADVRGKLPKKVSLNARYQYTAWLDTETKDPNPEHQVRVGADWRF